MHWHFLTPSNPLVLLGKILTTNNRMPNSASPLSNFQSIPKLNSITRNGWKVNTNLLLNVICANIQVYP